MATDERNLKSASFKEQTTSIQNALNEFRNNLEGYVWSGESRKYVYKEEPLEGSSVINSLVGFLSSFCFDSNLITSKEYQTFCKQQKDVCKQANRVLLRDPYSIPENHPKVYQMFDDILQNVGDIMLTSKGLMRDLLKADEEDKARTF